MTVPDLARLAIHTQTNRPWDLRTCCERYSAAGVGGISVWRRLLDPGQGGVKPSEAIRIIADCGLRVPSLVRGGFLVSPTAASRRAAIDENRRAIEEASSIGAESMVVVAGAHPDVPLEHAREMAIEGLDDIADEADYAGVRLALEPLHPMYAADRSCVSTLATANEMCTRLGRPHVGVAVDVYHVWWEPGVEDEIHRAGRAGRLFGFHLCDWLASPTDPLNDRGLMGDGCIDLRRMTDAVEATGFAGMHEIEVFSERYWSSDQDDYLRLIIDRYCAVRSIERD